MTYSFKKGLWKAVKTVGSGILLLLAVTTFGEVQITELITKYLFPIIGSLTLTGTVTLIVNFAKIKMQG